MKKTESIEAHYLNERYKGNNLHIRRPKYFLNMKNSPPPEVSAKEKKKRVAKEHLKYSETLTISLLIKGYAEG